MCPRTSDLLSALELEGLLYIVDDSLVYLIPQIWGKADHSRVLKQWYEVVFEAELEAWYTDPTVWPQNRDLKMFLEWFDVQFHSLVYDLSDGLIQVSHGQ